MDDASPALSSVFLQEGRKQPQQVPERPDLYIASKEEKSMHVEQYAQASCLSCLLGSGSSKVHAERR
jgi:hypothetical protein